MRTTSVHADNLNKIRTLNVRNKNVKRNTVCGTVLIFRLYSVRANDSPVKYYYITRARFIYFVFIPVSPSLPHHPVAVPSEQHTYDRDACVSDSKWFLFFILSTVPSGKTHTIPRRRTENEHVSPQHYVLRKHTRAIIQTNGFP